MRSYWACCSAARRCSGVRGACGVAIVGVNMRRFRFYQDRSVSVGAIVEYSVVGVGV